MARNLVCSERGGALQDGFILDSARYGRGQSVWVEGPPEKDFMGVNLDNPNYYINAYRCENCGLVMLYAGPDRSDENK